MVNVLAMGLERLVLGPRHQQGLGLGKHLGHLLAGLVGKRTPVMVILGLRWAMATVAVLHMDSGPDVRTKFIACSQANSGRLVSKMVSRSNFHKSPWVLELWVRAFALETYRA